jgi:signal transduction histidine kinase
MHRAARKLTRIVQNLFLLARGDAGGYPISMSRFYLGEVAGDCVRGMRSVASARRIEITFSTGEDPVLVADEELIHRLILNLVENAVKFTPDGGKVKVAVETAENLITIRVSDTGPGVTATDRAHIFERFFRGDRNLPQEGGAGLGLPIARWIAEVHGGKVRLERSDQDGSVFVAELPRCGE